MNKERIFFISIIVLLILIVALLVTNDDHVMIEPKQTQKANNEIFEIVAQGDSANGQTKLSIDENSSLEILENIANDYLDVALIRHGQETKKIAEDYAVSFELIYSSDEQPEIAVLTTHGGGNCCEPDPLLIDLQTNPIFVSESLSDLLPYSMQLTRMGNTFRLSGQSDFPVNSLGDHEIITLEYNRNDKSLYFLPYDKKLNLYELVNKHASTIFENSDTRNLLLDTLTETEFSRARKFFDVAGNNYLDNYRYIIGDGIMRHSGGSEEGKYIIDLITNSWLMIIQYDGLQKLDCYSKSENMDVMDTMAFKSSLIFEIDSQKLDVCRN